jgi:hypothetical protein
VYEIQLDNSENGIRDLADNLLQPNEAGGATRFTISIGGEEQDFSDAPLPFPTILLQNGASHVIEDGFYLGNTVDAEPDGIPSVNADGDVGDEDGVTFVESLVPGQTARVQVVASQLGRLDAWADFNQDGDWNDAGEQIFDSVVVRQGVNPLDVAVPETAAKGSTYVRFRLSRTGNLTPEGLALNGEVEDYRVDIVSQLPWQNEDNPLDVDDSNAVVPLDALLVINELNERVVSDPVTGLLPNPPVEPGVPENLGYVDVDGDGYASPRDALLVINHLNRNIVAARPASAEGELSTAIADASASVAVVEQSAESVTVLAAAALADAPVGISESSSTSSEVVEQPAPARDAGLSRAAVEMAASDPWSQWNDPRLNADEVDEWMDTLAQDVASSLADDEDLTGTVL